MNSRRAASSGKSPRAPKAPWRLARMIFLILMTWHRAATCLKPGKTRRGLTRFLRIALPKLEFCLRCLLVGMRAEAPPPKPVPFAPRSEAVSRETALPRRAPAFSLSLKGIAPDISPGTAPPSSRVIPDAAKPRSGTVSPAPTETFAARLQNIDAVLRDPLIFAQKIAAHVKRRGLRLRALKTPRPNAELWNLIHAQFRLPPQKRWLSKPAPHPDTS